MMGQTRFHHKILEKPGEGGMGTVYKAENTKLKRNFVLDSARWSANPWVHAPVTNV